MGTLDNLGKVGDRPTHPELLDWLAVEFVERGFSIKQMHRLILTSDAYRMASAFEDAGNQTTDPENRYHWKYRIKRLEAEIGSQTTQQVARAWQLAFGRDPSPAEVAAAVAHWDRQRAHFAGKVAGADAAPPADPRFLAWASLCHVLLNSNEFIYVD